MTVIIAFLLNNRIARFIGGVLAAFLGFVTFGMVQRRKGAVAARKQAEIDKLKAEAKGDAAVVESRRTGLTWQERLKRNRGGK